jgi:hypothetical protein
LIDFQSQIHPEIDDIIQKFNTEWRIRKSKISSKWSFTEWIQTKETWTKGKKKKYLKRSIQEYLQWENGYVIEMIHPFGSMVKSGESYYGLNDPSVVYMEGESSRPRNIFVPPAWNCGWTVYIQSLLFPIIKEVLPEFSHGWSKDDYKQWYIDHLKNDYWSVCIDGSAFDSTQWAELMDSVENRFLLGVFNEENFQFLVDDHGWSLTAMRSMVQSLQSLTSNDTTVFVKMPSLLEDAPEWDDETKKEFRKSEIKTRNQEPWKEYLAVPLHGSTFSGHTTKTTLGNTLRSLMYCLWYVKKAGICNTLEECRALGIWMQVAGDDCAIFGPKEYCLRIAEAIRANSISSTESTERKGLG